MILTEGVTEWFLWNSKKENKTRDNTVQIGTSTSRGMEAQERTGSRARSSRVSLPAAVCLRGRGKLGQSGRGG